MMAVLAALGGVASTYIQTLANALHAALGFPGATQVLAGLHVLWIVLAVGVNRETRRRHREPASPRVRWNSYPATLTGSW